jgi:uncharacterized repeat protein (TIGR03803 family)
MQLAGLLSLALAGMSPASAQIFSYSKAFSFDHDQASNPDAGLVEDGSGLFYGTAEAGGPSNDGAVLQFAPPKKNGKWTAEVLHDFAGGTDGQEPEGSLSLFDGALYGATYSGGSGANDCYAAGVGCGTVYELTPPPQGQQTWGYSILYSFSSVQADNDGANPAGGVYIDSTGTLYGTTSSGGGTSCIVPGTGCGVFFSISSGGAYSILYRFQGGADGDAPVGTLAPGPNGQLYGVTEFGGDTGESCTWGSFGCGTVYSVDKSGNETVLYRFTGGADGSTPAAALAVDNNGNIYGTTEGGGVSKHGVVFVLQNNGSSWTEQVIHSFAGGKDGEAPLASVTIVGGEVIGTTETGGNTNCSGGCGIAFAFDPPLPGKSKWTERILHRFTGNSDGCYGVSGMIPATLGLVGTMPSGGAKGDVGCQGSGMVYVLNVGP